MASLFGGRNLLLISSWLCLCGLINDVINIANVYYAYAMDNVSVKRNITHVNHEIFMFLSMQPLHPATGWSSASWVASSALLQTATSWFSVTTSMTPSGSTDRLVLQASSEVSTWRPTASRGPPSASRCGTCAASGASHWCSRRPVNRTPWIGL